jgi:hypothetical protein
VDASLEPELATRLDQMHVRLAGQASQIRRGAALTLLIGMLILGLLGAYFYYGYNQFSEFTEPERIAGAVQTLVDDNLPTMRKSVETEITKSAPILAEKLSIQLRENIPTARGKLEDYIVAQMKDTLAQGSAHTSERIAEFLRANRDRLRADAKELAKSPAMAESSIKDLETALDKEIGTDLKGQATEMLVVLNSLNEKLHKLSKPNNLNKTEVLERRLLQIARRLQMEQVPTADIVGRAAATAQPVSASRPARRDDRERGRDLPAKTAITNNTAKAEPAKKPELPRPLDKPKRGTPTE